MALVVACSTLSWTACFFDIASVRTDEPDATTSAGGAAGAPGTGGNPMGGQSAGGEPPSGGGEGGAGGEGGSGGALPDICQNLGFNGTCIGNVSIFWWDENDVDPPLAPGDPSGCWVRDCAAEGLTCEDLGDGGNAGYGCGPGTYTEQPCAQLGAMGVCSQDDETVVWWDARADICRWQYCPDSGDLCAFDGSLGRHVCM